jgi:amidase
MIDPVFIHRLPCSGDGIRVAVKDLIDLQGTPTTAGCAAVARDAPIAAQDAVCIANLRAAERRGDVRIVGKTNLHELAFGADGINAAFGTPTNPVDPLRIPGGSSSGSAVAVASDLADIAFGSDTGGSIRIPAACCAIVGLKTTWNRIPTTGVWPLAPFLDTVGPMARNIDDVVTGMELLEPGFAKSYHETPQTRTIGRVRVPGVPVDPLIDEAIDRALLACGVAVLDITIPFWNEVYEAAIVVLLAEAWTGNRSLLEPTNLGVSEVTEARLRLGEHISVDQLDTARSWRDKTKSNLSELFRRFDVIALPTLTEFPPLLSKASNAPLTALTRFANLTGLPALALPVPVSTRRGETSMPTSMPTSLQIIGPMNGEAGVLRAGSLVERAVQNEKSTAR